MGAGRESATPAIGAAPKAMPERMRGVNRTRNAVDIPIEKVERDPDQPREVFDEAALGRLAASLKTRGQLQAIRVRWHEGKGVYVIIAGERRWRAAKMAGLATVSAVVVDGDLSAAELLAVQLVENCLREDLRPVEQARAYRTLIDQHGWSIRQLAAELALDHTAVSSRCRSSSYLSRFRPKWNKAGSRRGRLTRSLRSMTLRAQAELASRVVAEGLSRAETVEAVRRVAGRQNNPKGRGPSKGRKASSRVFRKLVGCTVTVENGRGLEPRIVLERSNWRQRSSGRRSARTVRPRREVGGCVRSAGDGTVAGDDGAGHRL